MWKIQMGSSLIDTSVLSSMTGMAEWEQKRRLGRPEEGAFTVSWHEVAG